VTAAVLTPGSPEWLRVVTSSKVSAILGLSPWESPRSLYHHMRGELHRSDASAVQSRGHYLEPAIIAWWRDQHPEYNVVTRQHLALRDDLPWGAANLDGLATGRGVPDVVVEAKSAVNDWEWGAEGTDEVPAYYAAQTVWGMHLSGTRRTYMPIITSRLEFREYVIDYDAQLAADIEAECFRFWCDVRDGAAPPLDGHVATLESLRRLHPDIEPKTSVEVRAEIAREFVEATAASKAAAERERKARAELIDVMGTFARATCGDQTIATRRRHAAGSVALYPATKPVDLDRLPDSTTTERTEAA
jgi:putative phage-type endonuclease